MIDYEKQLLDCIPASYIRPFYAAIFYSLHGPRWLPAHIRRVPLGLLTQYAKLRHLLLRMGYGAKPHESAAKRRAGYPRGQTKPPSGFCTPRAAEKLPVNADIPWQCLLSTKDVTSRLDKHPFA